MTSHDDTQMPPPDALRPCAVCKGRERRLLFQQTFTQMSNGGSLLSGYDVVVCSHCGFCFADRIPEQSTFDRYYRDMSKYEENGSRSIESGYDQARFMAIADVVMGHLPSRSTRIFEVGCASGQLLALLKEQGYPHLSGIDPSPACAATAQDRYGLAVSCATLASATVTAASVEFLILSGVLEHVRDLGPSLLRLREMLVQGGLVLIIVPDATGYEQVVDAPFQEFSVEHINFFGPQSLANLMAAYGFAQVSIEGGTIESHSRTLTPVIYGVFKKQNTIPTHRVDRDSETATALSRYVSQSRDLDTRVQDVIAALVASTRPLIVWGTGAHTLRLLASSRLSAANIRAYVDTNPRYHGKQLAGVPIISPEALSTMPEPILISSRGYQEEIVHQIRTQLRLENEIICLY